MKKQNIKLVEETNKQPKESVCKATPTFARLTRKEIEALKNTDCLKSAYTFAENVVIKLEYESTGINFLIALMETIKKSVHAYITCKDGEYPSHPEDLIHSLQTYLFNQTPEHNRFFDSYLENLVSGNFAVKEIYTPLLENDYEAEPEDTLKAVA